jgi:hypothetical protein
MSSYFIILVLPIITAIKGFKLKGNTHLLDILSLIAYLVICSNINKSAPSLSIVIFEVVGLFIYGFGILFQVLKQKDKSSL